jgi:hypothetical protein
MFLKISVLWGFAGKEIKLPRYDKVLASSLLPFYLFPLQHGSFSSRVNARTLLHHINQSLYDLSISDVDIKSLVSKGLVYGMLNMQVLIY